MTKFKIDLPSIDQIIYWVMCVGIACVIMAMCEGVYYLVQNDPYIFILEVFVALIALTVDRVGIVRRVKP